MVDINKFNRELSELRRETKCGGIAKLQKTQLLIKNLTKMRRL